MTIETGALEQMFAAEETTTYRTPETLTATDGNRHLELTVTGKHNREPSPEKRGTPDEAQSLPRRPSQQFDLSQIMWEPTGTLGTPADIGKFLQGGMGTQNTATLDTTVNPAPAPTITGATLISTTGLVVGDIMLFDIGAGVLEATRIKTIASMAVTFDALTAVPVDPGRAVSGVSYKLASLLTKSYSIFKYHTAGGHRQAVYGAVVDRIQFTFDGTKEVMLAISGPAGEYADSTSGTPPQVAPGSSTTVGTPVGGLTGSIEFDGATFLVISATITMENALELRNKELGTRFASGIGGRSNLRKVNTSITFFLEDTAMIGKAGDEVEAVV